MGFVFNDEFQKHKIGAAWIENIVLRHQALSFFNHNLDWDKHTELDLLKQKITPTLIDEEPSASGKKALRFLSGMYAEPTLRGWIYTDTRGPLLTPYWDQAKREIIARAYKRAIDVVDVTIIVLSVSGAIGNREALFQEWFGDTGNTAADMLAMAAQYKRLRDALARVRVVSDDVSDRDSVASAATWEDLNVIYIGDDFWEPPGMTAEDRKRGLELQQVQACIHEWTHKYFSPKTDDVKFRGLECYGAEKCRQLAAHPAKAMRNADTAGYFAIDAWWNKYRASAFARGVREWGVNTQLKNSPKFDMI